MLEDFRRVIEAAGLQPSEIIADGKLHRCPVAGGKPGAKDASYIAHLDFTPTIWFQNFRTGDTGTWSPQNQRPLNKAGRCKLKNRIKADKQARQAEQARRWTEGAAKAQSILDEADLCLGNPYLETKGVKPCNGLKVDKQSRLLVPILGVDGKPQSLQTVTPDGIKRFLGGGKMAGGYFPIGAAKDGPLLICEGLATGLSLHQATNYTTLVAFNAGNLRAVAQTARQRYPDRSLIVCADDDRQTEGNPGRTKATAAAQATGGKLAMPVFNDGQAGTDFNDLHQTEGLEAVKAQIESAMETAPLWEYDEGSPFEDPTLPPLPSFPIEVLPPFLAEYVSTAARAFAVPVEMPATAMLALASSCIGRTRAIAIKHSWHEYANLFVGLVARSGLGKTPCTTAIFNSVYRLEHKWFDEWDRANREYMEAQAQYEAALRRKPKEDEPAPKRPEKPIRIQLFVDDATIESVADALNENPRGVLWHRDELSGLLRDLDKYSKESEGTKSRLLSAYDSKLWKINRKTQGKSLYIPHACLGIFGGVQPGVLPNLFSSEDRLSGLLPRFIFVLVRPSSAATWTDESISNKEQVAFDGVIERLLSLEFDVEGEPVSLPVEQSGKLAYEKWFDSLAWEQWSGTEYVEARFAKLKGQALRLALILHFLEWASRGDESAEPYTVQAATMEKALILADWFKLHQEQAWKLILGDENSPGHRPRDCDPVNLKVARAIVSLEAEIVNGRLLVGRIVEEVNKEIPEPHAISPTKIGKVCSRLGLGIQKSGGTRYRLINYDRLADFKKLFAELCPATPVPPAPSALNTIKTNSCHELNPPRYRSHPSHPTHSDQEESGEPGSGGAGANLPAHDSSDCNSSNKGGWDGWDGSLCGIDQHDGPTQTSKPPIFDHEVEI